MEEGSPIPKSEIRNLRNPKSLWLIAGLGNPGEEYADTYHNVGFRVVERIGRELGTRLDERCGSSLISGKVELGGKIAVLVLPQMYMNRSGAALAPVFERFESSVQDVIVVYDDVALPLGKLRLRQRGSAGGHNGIKSLISSFGSDEFLRVRVGVRPDREIGSVRDFVLSRVAKSDGALLNQAEEIAAKAVESLLRDGIEKAMAAYNGIDLREDQ
ncbi:MAG TPA: aminoacyl-tRNA hydrolase [Pyrinomonadaceae bacterium]|jgi:PTH1 family peptidyl-tRNA hydrolase|nr:aminoacyl-tRNA hydrolase [Pyrinomonadaceae bacterium]